MTQNPKDCMDETLRTLHMVSLLLSPSTVLDRDAREELASLLLSLLGSLEESLGHPHPLAHCPGCVCPDRPSSYGSLHGPHPCSLRRVPRLTHALGAACYPVPC